MVHMFCNSTGIYVSMTYEKRITVLLSFLLSRVGTIGLRIGELRNVPVCIGHTLAYALCLWLIHVLKITI